ncbi:hypothetical protein EAF00_001795 [Botryotinia globosa]|nr:hypothetical protein EAF00_001795 [Botryotinia globosa]
MSGFEIAGVVLGGFSFLYIVVEFFYVNLERVATWRQFGTRFLQFINAINVEKQLFSALLSRFLLSMDVPEGEVHLFLEHRSYEGWHREELITVFHLRLGKSYKGFKGLIKTVDSLIIEVNSLLASKDGRIDWPEERLSWFEYQVKRIRHSFSNRGPNALVALEKYDRKLQEILDSVKKVRTIELKKDDFAEAVFFSHIKKHSQSLYKAIEEGWSCECGSAHAVSIQLQNRTSVDSSIIFNLSFKYPEILKKALYPSDEQLSGIFSKWRKVETTRKARSILDSILPASPQQLSVAENVRQKLHRNIESKPKSTLNTRVSQVKKFGYLPADHSERHEFRYSDDNVTSRAFYRDEFVSLETILSKPDEFAPPSRYARYKVGYILASSLLQLQNVPWLTDNLQKRHIFFPCDWKTHKILFDQPHLPRSFFSTKCQSIPLDQTTNLSSPITAIKKPLKDLGIILLELCFGQRIEEKSIWQDFLVDGKEHASTNYLAALEWADAVREQEPALEHVIKCCLFCTFEEEATWDNLSFTQAVYANVVEPLEKKVNSWPNVFYEY